jgi:segregation and condensation protein A
MTPQDDYKVQLEVFEGPLDLLLYLIKKDELNIYDIPIERITSSYMQYLDLMRMLDLNIAGEFIVMAATLMMIKSRLLLPVEERPDLEDEEDPRWDLVRQLVEYKKFKDAAQHLEALEHLQENIFVRDGEVVNLGPDPEVGLQDVSIFDLISAFNEALKKAKKEDLHEIFTDRYTVAEQVDFIMNLIKREGHVLLTRVFQGMEHRYQIVCTFLAVLELMRMKQIRTIQSEQFGEIEVIAVES